MGFLVNGIFGGGTGADFKAQGANVVGPQNQNQANQLYGQNQQGLAAQMALMQALAGQNGIGNQSSVFNQLQGVANGTGPNPAQAMLQQATGQNVDNQAALMAGQRGASANPGLIARQAAMQGANLQQQAVGQGATLQANQGLNALGQLSGIAGQQVGQQQNAALGYNQAAQGLMQGANNASIQNASQQNQANSAIATQNAKSQQGILGGIGNAIGGALGLNQGGAVPDGPRSMVGRHLKEHYKEGGKVRGKAQVAGDSVKNDTVPAMLSPGEIVVPRSHAKDPEKAAAFARAVAQRNMKKGK